MYMIVMEKPSEGYSRARSSFESDSPYRLLFENNPQPMWVFDEETLRFLEVNAAAVRLYGYSREEFLAMTVREIRPPAELPGFLEFRSQLTLAFMEFGAPTHWTHRLKNGRDVEVECKGASTRFNGRAARLIVIEEVTERRKMAERLHEDSENFHLLFNTSGEGILIHEDGCIRAANPSLGRMLGYGTAEFFGKNVLEFVAPESQTHVISRMHTASSEPMEFSLFRADGTRLRVIANTRTIRHQGRAACLVWLRDVSERVFGGLSEWMREGAF